MTTERIITKARNLTAARTTEQLVRDFALTDDLMAPGLSPEDHAAIVMSRGWIMDELETRDPVAMTAWCNTEEMSNDDLRRCFLEA